MKKKEEEEEKERSKFVFNLMVCNTIKLFSINAQSLVAFS